MNIKKAIEFLEGEITYWGPTISKQLKKIPYACEPGNPLAVKLYKEIIVLLKRGEKYEKMFNTILNWTMHDGQFIPAKELVNLEQKYFPKLKEESENKKVD